MRLARTSAVIDTQKQLLIPLLLAVGFFFERFNLRCCQFAYLRPLSAARNASVSHLFS